MTATEHASENRESHATESALRDMLNATAFASSKDIMKHTFMIAMEHATENGEHHAMESALRDLQNAVEVATLKNILTKILTYISIHVKAQENASKRINSAMEPALMKEQSAETTCASAVNTRQTAGN